MLGLNKITESEFNAIVFRKFNISLNTNDNASTISIQKSTSELYNTLTSEPDLTHKPSYSK